MAKWQIYKLWTDRLPDNLGQVLARIGNSTELEN